MNKKQIDYLIHIIALSMAAHSRMPQDKLNDIEPKIKRVFYELGDD